MRKTLAAVCLAGALLAACAPPAQDAADREPKALVVYSGRSETLVGPLLEKFGADTGIEVQVRYGETAELAATLLEEGRATPADVYLSQDAAALGRLSDGGMLRALPADLLARVDGRFRSPAGDWVGLSGRARTVVYNTELADPEALPQRLEDVTAPIYKGKFGLAPPNASLQAHLAVYRAVHGQEALESLTAGIAANEPVTFPNNSTIVAAVLAGEIEWGLVNHYYLWRALKEDPTAPGANFHMPGGEASSYVNLAGAAVLSDAPQAIDLVGFLLSDEAQQYFAAETFEYPLTGSVAAPEGLAPLAEVSTPDVDYGEVSAVLEETLETMRRARLLG